MAVTNLSVEHSVGYGFSTGLLNDVTGQFWEVEVVVDTPVGKLKNGLETKFYPKTYLVKMLYMI